MKAKHFKFTETALCLLVIIAAVAIALFYSGTASAEAAPSPLELADVGNSAAASEIASLVNDGILPVEIKDGYAYFYPDAHVTREYIAAALAKALKIDALRYSDVSLGVADEGEISAEFLPYVRALAYAGKIPVYVDDVGGKETMYFYPKTEVTRETAAMLISWSVAGNASSSKTSSFSDKDEISPELFGDVDKLVGLGIVDCYSDGSFRPKQPITREEFAVMLQKAISLGYIK